ncbi:hypothetical protein CLAFUW4_06712 [Fulvia fulva]|uniref:Uncharacterized protein n=1 Tax=Passalora fulva TaxID=5499 RepID=A0A9Q8LJA8_PASFU|nr:uncharacterized protein CLAFUR5_06854 [Fulvia fulva]KAK4621781.1 hypothetical protein CLAFUR4_06720 [Fulvia fulva]KAK4623078.1 hypothetical protein CLAFUR0_06714 [Fulvia fulva]UJO18438.1 hypothetical protein CLAFUR5_06854 [Fulvia fulva]WPV15898.1 hypothetical protein CLAFUW4_06712 [Fulvia fulva]WPV30736.1 hypothetical protein CLAFUW7_06711 [Fulvia fulva]
MRRDDELPLVLEGISTMRGYALFGAAWLASSSRTPPSYGQPPTAYGAAQTSGHNSLTWHHVPYKMQYPHTSNASSGFANQTATNEPPSYGTSIRQTSNPSSNTTFYPTSSRPASISPIVPTNFTVLPVPTPSGPISANTTKTGSLNCASCLFGAATATLHRFPYTFVATLTVTIAPQVIIHPNGSREATTITRSPTQLSSFQSAASTLRTFTDDREKTWSTLGVTMSFPTTYIQYASFERAQLRNASGRIANCSGAYTCWGHVHRNEYVKVAGSSTDSAGELSRSHRKQWIVYSPQGRREVLAIEAYGNCQAGSTAAARDQHKHMLYSYEYANA